MIPQKNTKIEWENVKLPKPLVDRVRAKKEETLVPITSFVANAVEEQLNGGLIGKIKEDEGLYQAWKANIAMAFKDNLRWYKEKTGKRTFNQEDYHNISNKAAEYFLNLLIK